MKIILISGKAKHGKDTTAAYLSIILESLGYRVLIAHYGDLVKYVCRTFFNWDGQKDEAGRALLQRVGTDMVRTQDEDYWANMLVDMLSFFPDEWDFVLIPDCRFPNELSIPKKEDGQTIHVRVVRPNFDNGLTPEQQAHPSETALDNTPPDTLLYNDGTLADLRKTIGRWVLRDLNRWLEEGPTGDQGHRGDPGACPKCGRSETLVKSNDGYWLCAGCGWGDCP